MTDRSKEELTALQAELDRLLAERDTVASALHNSGDLKYARRLEALERDILTLQTALGDGRV